MKNSAATREFWCNAALGAWKAKATCFSTTAATVPSRRSPRRPGLTTPASAMDLAPSGATMTTTAGLTCTSPTTRGLISCTTTGSMGVDFGDYTHDGRLSIYVTNFTEQPNNLYRNLGMQGFTDVGWASKTGQPSYPYVKWGTGFVDFSNTGWLDIFVANGHVYPQVDAIPGGPKYREPMQLFRNSRDGTFEDISAVSGLGQIPLACRRGAAFGDVNNDGNIDMVILNVGEPPTLLIKRSRNANHRVLFKLRSEEHTSELQ